MKVRKLRIIVALMSVAVLGLVFLQFYWVDNAFRMQEINFDQNVNEAMNEVVEKLRKNEAMGYIYQQVNPGAGQTVVTTSRTGKAHAGIRMESRFEINPPPDPGMKNVRPQKKHRFSSSIVINGKEITDSSMENGVRIKQIIDSSRQVFGQNQILMEIFKDLNFNFQFTPTVTPRQIDSLLKISLKNHNADAKFQWGIYKADIQDFLLPTGKEDVQALSASPYKIHLYAASMFPKPEYLILHFPDKKHFLLYKLGFVLLSSAFLILLIIFSFGYTILALLKQKKLSEMKSDFINNMTHEFKTPVSTILLAADALKDSDITENRERIHKLADVIDQENKRIASHVEKVLQLAVMEKGDFSLKLQPIDVHEMIKEVSESFRMQVEHKGGSIESRLGADRFIISGDKLHFENVLRNLADNAIKYCDGPPVIVLSTHNNGDHLIIGVKDNGIGLTREQQQRVFEQFYRAHTGNVHNVKGFGLGLHYVKTIVDMHRGKIRVESEKNKGSYFEINIPLMDSEHE